MVFLANLILNRLKTSLSSCQPNCHSAYPHCLKKWTQYFSFHEKIGPDKREMCSTLCCFYLSTLAPGLLLKSSSLTGRHLLHRLLILCELYFAFLEVILSQLWWYNWSDVHVNKKQFLYISLASRKIRFIQDTREKRSSKTYLHMDS